MSDLSVSGKYMERNEVENKYDVVIVGGGIAGITAARHLIGNNVTNIMVLEAQNYLGGRIKTINTEYGHLDLGAEWIHGEIGNPIYKLASDNKLTESRQRNVYVSPSSASQYEVHEFRTEFGKIVERPIVSEVSKVMEDLYEMQGCETRKMDVTFCPGEDTHPIKCENINGTSENGVTTSMEKHFSDGFNKYFKNSMESEIVDEMKQALFRWRLKWELGDNSCVSLKDVAFPGRYLSYGGNGLTDLKHGYHSVFKILEKDVPEKCIRMSSPVKEIEWEANLCFVKCLEGPTYQADHVIVTVPIGYLQKHCASFFYPTLPMRKIQAIHSVGFSSIKKIFVVWDEPFWKGSFNGVQFVWTRLQIQEEIKNRIISPNKTKKDGNPWYYDITGFERVTGRPNILCGWIVGEGAEISRHFNTEEISKTCSSLLRVFLNDQHIPEPDQIYSSQWGSNEYVGGGYSYVSTRTQDGDFEVLCEPLPSKQNPRVLFGGEATSFNYYSTVHGAYQSGIRTAQEILEARQELK